MNKQFLEKKSAARKDHGSRLIDVTINNKMMHYVYEALAKYQEFVTTEKERIELTLLVDEINKIKEELNKIK